MSSILVVDDDADIRLLLRLELSTEGHQIAEAANGEQALRRHRGRSARSRGARHDDAGARRLGRARRRSTRHRAADRRDHRAGQRRRPPRRRAARARRPRRDRQALRPRLARRAWSTRCCSSSPTSARSTAGAGWLGRSAADALAVGRGRRAGDRRHRRGRGQAWLEDVPELTAADAVDATEDALERAPASRRRSTPTRSGPPTRPARATRSRCGRSGPPCGPSRSSCSSPASGAQPVAIDDRDARRHRLRAVRARVRGARRATSTTPARDRTIRRNIALTVAAVARGRAGARPRRHRLVARSHR